jgi:signal transduction histidine kinase
MSQTTTRGASIFRPGIRRSLVLCCLGLFGIALGLNTFAGSIYMRQQIQRSTGVMQTEVATLTARHVQTYIAQKIQRLHDAATNMSLYPLGSEEHSIIANLLLKNDQSFQEISVLNDQGQERLRISERKVYLAADLRDLRKNAAYENVLRGQDYVSPVYTSDRAEPYLFLAVPVTDLDKKRVGVAVAKSSMKFLWNLVREERFGRAGVIYLVNEKGQLIAHKNPLRVLENPNLENVPAVAEFVRTQASRQIAATRGRGLSGEDVLSTFAVVPGLGWAVVVEEPVTFALEDVKKLEQFTRTLLVVGLLVGFISIVIISNRITKPILTLRDGAIIIGKGNLDHRVNIGSNDEIGELGANFNQMADTIKASQNLLETRVQLRTRELSVLYGVTTLVNQALDVTSVLNYGIEQITELFHFDTIRFFLFDDLFETLTLSASYNSSQAPTAVVGPFRRGGSVIGRVAESGEPAIFEDTETDPQYLAWSQSKTAHTAGFRFLAALPIKTKAQIFGVAAFCSKVSRQLSNDDAKLLNAICEQIAIAVEKARLFEEITMRSEAVEKSNQVLRNEIIERMRAQDEVSRQHRRIQTLYHIGTSINSTLDQKLLLESLFTQVELLFSNSAISICLVDPNTGRLVGAGQRNVESGLWTTAAGDWQDSHVVILSKIVVEQKLPMVVKNFKLASRPSLFEPWINNGWAAYIGLPLLGEGHVLGVMGFYFRECQNFSSEEIDFLKTIAGELTSAILNTQLYKQSQQQGEELLKANKAKDEFLNVMSHELRTPLNVIGGYGQVLSQGILGEVNHDQKDAAEKIIYHSTDLLRMINQILQVGKLQAGSVQAYIENIDLNDMIKNLKNTFDALPKKGLSLNWDVPSDLPVVRTDGDKLAHVLQNLLYNAIKFTEEGSVTLFARCAGQFIEFKVKDTGIGIPQDMMSVIFDMFRQVDSSQTRSQGGLGIGLFIVKKFTEILGGKIKVGSTPGLGTTVTLTIPGNYVVGSLALPVEQPIPPVMFGETIPDHIP